MIKLIWCQNGEHDSTAEQERRARAAYFGSREYFLTGFPPGAKVEIDTVEIAPPLPADSQVEIKLPR